MSRNSPRFLLDVNTLVALADREHVHYRVVTRWFDSTGRSGWGVCAFTEAGFLRVSIAARSHSVGAASELLRRFAQHPGYRYWPVTAGWSTLVSPFRDRIYGHQQITDAFLLGLAVKGNGVLVTLDKALAHLAGTEYRRHLLVLE